MKLQLKRHTSARNAHRLSVVRCFSLPSWSFRVAEHHTLWHTFVDNRGHERFSTRIGIPQVRTDKECKYVRRQVLACIEDEDASGADDEVVTLCKSIN